MVGRIGFEPMTNWLKANCSTDWANDPQEGGILLSNWKNSSHCWIFTTVSTSLTGRKSDHTAEHQQPLASGGDNYDKSPRRFPLHLPDSTRQWDHNRPPVPTQFWRCQPLTSRWVEHVKLWLNLRPSSWLPDPSYSGPHWCRPGDSQDILYNPEDWRQCRLHLRR